MEHSNDNHNEPKPVSFAAPLILGLVTVFIILSFVSMGDPCNDCCCKKGCETECAEACEKGGHEMKAGEAKDGEKSAMKEEEKEAKAGEKEDDKKGEKAEGKEGDEKKEEAAKH